MDDALFRTDPAELTVRDEVAPCFAPVGDEVGEVLAFDSGGEEGDCLTYYLVSTTDGEGLGMLVRVR